MLNKQNTSTFYSQCMDITNFTPVTLNSRQATNQASFLGYQIPRARQKTFNKSEASPMLAARTETWQIWQDAMDAATPVPPAALPVPAPKVSDQIIDLTGNVWIIKSVENTLCQEDTTGNVWNCTTVLSAAAA